MRYTTRIIVPPRVRRSGGPGTLGIGPRPQPLGVRKTFGFGDRLGLAAPGHLAIATAHPDFAPVIAQQSVRELAATGRTPQEVIGVASRAVAQARFRHPWGADANRLKTPQEVEIAAAAGFTYFTIDPSEYVPAEGDRVPAPELAATIAGMVGAGELPEDWSAPYLDRTIELPGNQTLVLGLEPVSRAAVKLSRAIQHCARMSETVARACEGRPYELEVCLDEIGAPLSAVDHLFLGLELEARGVRLTSLAIRIAEPLEPGADYRGHLARFELALLEHAAVAEFCGPYKLCFHASSDKPAIYPIIGRICRDALHLKTSGVSYIEALRIVLRFDPGLFREVAAFGRERFAECVAADTRFSTTVGEVAALPDDVADAGEAVYLDSRIGRQLFLATYAPLLTVGRSSAGRPFRLAILELVEQQIDVYQELLVACFETQFGLLNAG